MKVIAKKNRELALINAQNTQNENRAETITLVVPEEYEDYNKKIVFITDDETVWDIITNNEYKITNAITKYKQVDFYIWLTKEVDGESIDFRTKTKTLNFYHNVDASDEITDEEIHGVNTVVNLLEEEIEKVENLNIEATKVGSTTTVTITKKDGTTESVEINDGTDGQDGRDGQDGYTPQKGVDYFTEHDIEEIEGDILNEVYTKTQTDTLLEEKADVEDIPDVSSFITKDVNNLTNYTLKTNTGSLIDLEINDTTYVVTLKLKNQDGTVISTDTIDLPLESVVVSGRYDNTTKKVILTLENGSEVDFSVADLVAGLQTEITSQNKLASDLVDDTNSGNKFVTTSEKQTWNNKLDESDLTDYVKNTDYATNQKGGVIKNANGLGISNGGTTFAFTYDYNVYKLRDSGLLIGKGTLENVITGKQLINQTQLNNSQATQDDEIEALQTENARLKATLPTTTGEGQDITLNKTAELEFIKPPLPMGNSEQESTNNLLYLDSVRGGLNDIEPTLENGIVHLKGTNNEEYNTKGSSRNGYVMLNTTEKWKPSTAYYVSFKMEIISNPKALDTSYFSCGLFGEQFDNVQYNTTTGRYEKQINTPSSISDTANNKRYLEIRVDGMEVNISEVSLKTVEDYTFDGYGIKPSPEHESPITNVTGDVEVKVQNKNLFDGSKEVNTNFTNSVATALNHFIQTGEYATGYCNNSNQISAYAGVYETCFVPISENTNYHISSQASENNGFSSINILDKNGNLLQSSNNWVGAGYAFTTPSNAKYLMFGTRTVNIDYIQLIKGTTSIPLVPHKEQVLPLTLGNIELCKIGDYQDYFYKESNKWYLHKEIAKKVLDGSENWGNLVQIGTSNYYRYENVDFRTNNCLEHSTYLSDKFIYNTNTMQQANVIGNSNAVGANRLWITIDTSLMNGTTINDFKTWLSIHNTIVYYVLATPTDTEITDTTLISQLEAINNALSYEEQTNISSNTIALFNVEAYQSTKLILKEMATAIVALGGV